MDSKTTETVSKKELKQLREKAKKYDELLSKIDKCYEMDESGELIDKDSDLCTMGEIVCSHFGYL